MKSRPEYILCVRRHKEDVWLSWCEGSDRPCFLDAEPVENTKGFGSRLVACPECLVAIKNWRTSHD